jgi:putative endonuclease
MAEPRRQASGRASQAGGIAAEAAAAAALEADGWTILARRLRTPEGEIDLVAECRGLLAFVEVKSRPRLSDAAYALSPRQRARLLRAGAVALAENPGWGREGVRFDVLLVDAEGAVRRIADAFRAES